VITLIKKGLKILFYSDSSSEIEFVKKATSFFVPGAEFSSKFQDGYWDGTYKNLPCQQDVYVWFLKYRFVGNDFYEEIRGHVTLVR